MRFIRILGAVLCAFSTFCAASVLAQVPDFRLTDVSAVSPRRGTPVSPRDYIMQVSGFYFGSAT